MELLGLDEAQLRLAAFLGGLGLWALAEALWPRRPRRIARLQRWPTNLAIMALGGAVVRLISAAAVPLIAVAVAVWAESRGLGLFNVLALPGAVEVVAAVLILDLAIWAQHVAFHHFPLLWRLHRVHHADRELDVTSGLRFHPAEIAASMLIKCLLVLALGAAPLAVLLFEVILNGCAMFNHANLRLAPKLDGALRRLIVTPDLHRVHHSILPHEQFSNFGFNLSIWDRLFGLLRDVPEGGQLGMTIGVAEHQHDGPDRLGFSLRLPLLPLGTVAADATGKP